MSDTTIVKASRRPRFRRAAVQLAFRLTEGDVRILCELARHRFLRSTHIAALVGRSLDRTNDRLLRLFHSGYVDRPRAQLDYYPASGSAPMVYALADSGARLLHERGIDFPTLEWNRRNSAAGRSFIEHQLEVMDFQIAVRQATRSRTDARMIPPEEIIASAPEETRAMSNPFALRASIGHDGTVSEIGIVPDLVFGLMFPDGSRRCFMVEVDRGTMPISRSDLRQTSFERKMRTYLAAHAANLHEQQFGWRTFRVLVTTTDEVRMRSMQEVLRQHRSANSLGPSLFFFATRSGLRTANPLTGPWRDGNGGQVRLV